MSLINSLYFIGERNIPNSTSNDVLSTLNYLIEIHEKKYRLKSLGYELFKAFNIGLLEATVDQRYLDILLGKEFTGRDGQLKKWNGLVSVTESTPSLQVSLSSANDIFFTVGIGPGNPVDGDITYVNTSLANKNYRVVQRMYGPLETLKDDNSNSDRADIIINPSGGFTWRNANKFAGNDKYVIEMASAILDISSVEVVPEPDSPAADYVYYYWLKNQSTQTTGIGEVKPVAQNAAAVTAMEKMCSTWNAMVEKTKLLTEFLSVNSTVYPEFQKYALSQELEILLTRLNPFFN
jgi:hypothetical protein